MNKLELSCYRICYKLTDDMHMANLAYHRLRVHLTHVTTGVFGLYAPYVQVPGALVIVGYAESTDPSYYLTVDSQDHLPIEMYPGHL